MRKSAWLMLAVWVVAAAANAQLSPEYKEWPNSPAGFLLTKAEKKEYQEIKADTQAKAWIELFWAKRDPDLGTVFNEFEGDFDARVAAADLQFSTDKVPGSMTDRGRTLIVMGLPSTRAAAPASAVPGAIENHNEDDRGAAEVWLYRKDRIPANAGIKADELRFYFVETRRGLKDYTLDRGNTMNAMALKALAIVPESLVKNPKLTEVPRMGLIAGSKQANSEQLSVLSSEPRRWPEGAVVATTWGFQNLSRQALWVYVQLPDAVPAATQAIGRLRSVDSGQEEGTFVAAVQPLSVRGARGYEFTFQLASGKWAGDIALLAGTEVVAVATVEGTIDPLGSEGTQFSPFYWTVDVRQDPAGFGSAFNIGGWHVILRPDDTYLASEMQKLDLFVMVARPPMGEDGKPKQFDVDLQLIVHDKPGQRMPLGQHAPSDMPGTGLYFIGVPLPQLQRPGEYRFDLTLMEPSTNLSQTARVPLKVVADPGAAAPAPGK